MQIYPSTYNDTTPKHQVIHTIQDPPPLPAPPRKRTRKTSPPSTLPPDPIVRLLRWLASDLACARADNFASPSRPTGGGLAARSLPPPPPPPACFSPEPSVVVTMDGAEGEPETDAPRLLPPRFRPPPFPPPPPPPPTCFSPRPSVEATEAGAGPETDVLRLLPPLFRPHPTPPPPLPPPPPLTPPPPTPPPTPPPPPPK